MSAYQERVKHYMRTHAVKGGFEANRGLLGRAHAYAKSMRSNPGIDTPGALKLGLIVLGGYLALQAFGGKGASPETTTTPEGTATFGPGSIQVR